MTIQHSTAVRNGRGDSLETTVGTAAKLRLYTGAQPANCAAARTGTLIVEFTLASDWLTAASGGAKTLNGVPYTQAALAAGTIGHYALMDSAGTTCHEQGAASGDGLTFDTLIVNAIGQNITLSSWTRTEPGA